MRKATYLLAVSAGALIAFGVASLLFGPVEQRMIMAAIPLLVGDLLGLAAIITAKGRLV